LQRARQKLGVVVGYESIDGNPPVSTWTLDGDRDDGPVSRGTTAQGGTTAGQDAVPPCATSNHWHNVAQGQDQEICQQDPVVPHKNGHTPPSGLTPESPGQTSRVLAAVAKAHADQEHLQKTSLICPCGEALLPDNETGLCAECRYLARQDVIVRELDRLGGEAS
jgi:hypothetical protein